MELKLYFEIINRRKWVVVLTLFATTVVAIAGSLLMTPVYEATATLRVAGATMGSVDASALRSSDTLMNTYTAIAVSQPVLEELKQTLDLQDLSREDIEVETILGTELITITSEATIPENAQAIANSLVQILVDQSQLLYVGGASSAQQILGQQLIQAEEELNQVRLEYEIMLAQGITDETQLDPILMTIDFKEGTYGMLLGRYEQARLNEEFRINAVTIVELASLPEFPAKPQKLLNLLLGVLVGGIGGISLALLFDNLDSTTYTRLDVENTTRIPVLGEIPDSAAKFSTPFRRGTLKLNGSLAMDEAFRALRLQLLGSVGKIQPRSILVTSAEPGEGKSTVVAKLATSFAQAGLSVVIVDSNLRTPTQHSIWDLPNHRGLTSVLAGQDPLVDALQTTPMVDVEILTSGPQFSRELDPLSLPEQAALKEQLGERFEFANVHILPSGPPMANSADMLGLQKIGTVIEELNERFDFVLLDSPGLLAVSDALMLAQSVDCVMLVAAQRQVSNRALAQGIQQLAAIGAEPAGIIINRSRVNRDYFDYLSKQQLSVELPEVKKAPRDEPALVQDLTLAARAKSALQSVGIVTVQQVLDEFAEGGDVALMEIKGFGREGLNELKQQMRSLGIELPESEELGRAID